MGQALYYDFQGNAMVRINGPERPLLLQIAADRRDGVRSLFTLHSASGYARRSGDVELVKIAGFCHGQNKLRNVMMQSIQSVVDPASGEIIDDLAEWMELSATLPLHPTAEPRQDAVYQQPETVAAG